MLKNQRMSFEIALIIFICCTLSACQHPGLNPDETPLKQRYYDVDIRSFDGTLLRATVYQPQLSAGQTAPVIIHSHSFATFRMSQPLSMYGTIMFAGKTALKLWHQGYWVISFDQRGHGDSGDEIHLMSPDYEIKDVSAVIDWAEQHLPQITQLTNATATTTATTTATGSAIGMLGESYSGSMQLLASTQDPRIDALVPIHTWYDLSQSLYPQGVAKGWLTTLILAGNLLNYDRMDAGINGGYLYTRKKGGITDAFVESLEKRSFKTFCEQGQLPQADALLFQGFHDTLFGIDQGVQIRECFLRAGKDVRFIGTQKGHILPLVQQDGLMPFHNVDKQVLCDQHQYATDQMIIDWFDEKLKSQPHAARYIPKVCLTLNQEQGFNMADIPVGGQSFTFSPASIHSGYAGLMTSLLPSHSENQSAWLRPAFIPLTQAQTRQYLLGIPLLNATITAPLDAPTPTLFIGLAHKHRQKIKLINQQVVPVHGTGEHKLLLNGVSATLEAGDQVGILIYSYHNQYRMAGSGLSTQAKIQGNVELPLINDQQKNLSVLQANNATPYKTWKDLPEFYQPAIVVKQPLMQGISHR
jgi:ABC-2 type transport system ATP-binding protein